MTLVGTVQDKCAILVDDMAGTKLLPPLTHHLLPNKPDKTPSDTCGTLAKAAYTLREHGASEIVALVTHGIFSGNALKTLNDCDALGKVVATNTVPFSEKRKLCAKLEEIDVSPTYVNAPFLLLKRCWVLTFGGQASGGL